MTALAGAWSLVGDAADDLCARMLQAQALYGPHDLSVWRGPPAALGRRLYRTLPEDRFDRGAQPLANGGVLLADVRLDDRPGLCARLGLGEDESAVLCDAALLARGWDRWGAAVLDDLVADFALAVWDPRACRLTLARDLFGRRPLFWRRAPGLIAFASMPLGLQALEDAGTQPDMTAIIAHLRLAGGPGDSTLTAGVRRVLPGQRLEILPDREFVHALPLTGEAPPHGADARVAELRRRLDMAVAARMRRLGSPLASHLSSGWDSAAVTATAARLLAGNESLLALTAAPRTGFDGAVPKGRLADESDLAAQLAAMHPNVSHRVVRSSVRSPLAHMDRWIRLAGYPPLNPCNQLWLDDLHVQAAAGGANVVLTGDFGNLTLTADGLEDLADLPRRAFWRRWLRLAQAARRARALSWPGVMAAAFEPDPPTAVWRALRGLAGRALPDARRHSPLPPDLWSNTPAPSYAGTAERIRDAVGRFELGVWAKYALAVHGVDLRDPLLDRRLVSLRLGLDGADLAQGGRLRGLARAALADRVPAVVLDNPARGWQAADWYEGLAADRARLAEAMDGFAQSPQAGRLLDLPRLQALLESWPAAGFETDAVVDDYRLALQRGLAMGRFIMIATGRND